MLRDISTSALHDAIQAASFDPATKDQFVTKHVDVGACHDLQFSRPWKCSSAVSSAANITLLDGALRVQEHAAWSAFNDSSCLRKRVFPRLQDGETFRRFPKVSEVKGVLSQPIFYVVY